MHPKSQNTKKHSGLNFFRFWVDFFRVISVDFPPVNTIFLMNGKRQPNAVHDDVKN